MTDQTQTIKELEAEIAIDFMDIMIDAPRVDPKDIWTRASRWSHMTNKRYNERKDRYE